MKKYTINQAPAMLNCANLLSSGAWDKAEVANIDIFRPESGEFHPETTLRMFYNESGIFGRFEVKDQYVRCMTEGFQAPVCTDSCVEFFVEPTGNKGYINFEFSGSGAFLCSHIIDPTRAEGGFADFEMLPESDAMGMISASTLPAKIEEITEAITWELGFYIPFAVFERRGFAKPTAGTTWRANFYKCGDKTKFPHWASWNPVKELNFHAPDCFETIQFA